MDTLLTIALFPVGMATFLLLFSWPLAGVMLGRWIVYRVWGYGVDEGKATKAGFWFMIAGAVVFWLLWRYVLPDAWIAATPLLSAD